MNLLRKKEWLIFKNDLFANFFLSFFHWIKLQVEFIVVREYEEWKRTSFCFQLFRSFVLFSSNFVFIQSPFKFEMKNKTHFSNWKCGSVRMSLPLLQKYNSLRILCAMAIWWNGRDIEIALKTKTKKNGTEMCMRRVWMMRIVKMQKRRKTKNKNFVAGMIMLLGEGDVTMMNSLPMFWWKWWQWWWFVFAKWYINKRCDVNKLIIALGAHTLKADVDDDGRNWYLVSKSFHRNRVSVIPWRIRWMFKGA